MSCRLTAAEALAHCPFLNTHCQFFILRLDNGSYDDPIDKARAIFRMILLLKSQNQMSEAGEVYEYGSHIEAWYPSTIVKVPSPLESITRQAQKALNIEDKSTRQKEEASSPSDDVFNIV